MITKRSKKLNIKQNDSKKQFVTICGMEISLGVPIKFQQVKHIPGWLHLNVVNKTYLSQLFDPMSSFDPNTSL